MTQNFNFALVSGTAILLAACGGNYTTQTSSTAPANPVRNPQYVTVTVLDTTRLAGGGHALGLPSDGHTVYAWGTNTSDQLGTGNHTVTNTPALIPGMSNVRAIAAGAVHSIAVNTSGTVLTWGTNSYGQLGIASSVVPTPKVVPGISTAVAVAAGPYNSAVLLADGTVRAWGYNAWGQLGTGNFTNASTPQVVTGASNIVQISFANGFLLLLASNGTVYTVGLNSYGQLGNHANTNSNGLLQPTGVGGSGTLTLP